MPLIVSLFFFMIAATYGSDLKFAGQATLISQTSSYSEHDKNAQTLSADFAIDKNWSHSSLFALLQFASGQGVDAKALGGAMVNNDVMEDPSEPNAIYLAKLFYRHRFALPSGLHLSADLGKVGVNDYFDQALATSDQTTQFLNQAVNNNGAFDFAQGLDGRGYTYGARLGLGNEKWQVDIGAFSSDGNIQNMDKKRSFLLGIKWTPNWVKDKSDLYQLYIFSNEGEYARFEDDGDFVSENQEKINTASNEDSMAKSGIGLSLNHQLHNDLELFAKLGRQDDDRDVRHYQDMDETYLLGLSMKGAFWRRERDTVGIAYEIARLTGNHRKAHEKGYASLFDRSNGIGEGNYGDERVSEIYYRAQINDIFSASLDFQNIENFNYDSRNEDVQFFAIRLHVEL